MKARSLPQKKLSPQTPQNKLELVPFIPVAETNLSGREKEYVLDCLETGWISSNGTYVTRFEREFERFVGSPHAVSICNGTCALHVALLALDIKAGDEVIIPSFTYIATANAVRYTGAIPVFVDCEKETWNMDVRKLEAAITSKTKAIIPVHLYGHCCQMTQVMDIARKHGLFVIEDAAEAFGSKYNGRMAGTIGTLGVYSFFGNKTITTGEGGMVVTSDENLAKKVRLLKGQGVSPTRQYYFETVGYNYRMTNIEAAIGLAQLENATKFIEHKRMIAAKYNELLKNVPGIQLPVEKKDTYNSYWMYSIVVHPEYGITRDELIQRLKASGVETRRFFYPCHTMPPYQKKGVMLPVCEEIAEMGLNLPSSTKLTLRQVEFIAKQIKSYAK